jgi:hypothetical protein
LSPGFAFCNHWAIILDIPSPSLLPSTTLQQKKVKKKTPALVTLIKNNSVDLGLSPKIIRGFKSNFYVFLKQFMNCS